MGLEGRLFFQIVKVRAEARSLRWNAVLDRSPCHLVEAPERSLARNVDLKTVPFAEGRT